MLLKFAKVLGKENVRNGFFGQETNITTYNLCRINMFLHDIDYDKFNIAHGDTLIDPHHWDNEPFEAIVAYFIAPPTIDFDLTKTGNIADNPFIAKQVRKLVIDGTKLMVNPHRIVVPLGVKDASIYK